MRSLFSLLLALSFFLTPQLSHAQTTFDVHEIAWTMTPDASGESVHFQMDLNPIFERDTLTLRIPYWRPGSYRYAAYERSMSNLTIVDQEGREREWMELDPRAWEVETAGATSLRVSYDMKVENDAADGKIPAIHMHSPAVFLYLEEARELPHRLSVNLPKNWSFASGHRPSADGNGFRSPNFDVFVDCPMAVGDLEFHEFESHGRPIRVVLYGRTPSERDFNRADWLAKVAAIVNAGWDLMGDFPFEEYTFLFLFNNIGGYYGLEHLNSTSIAYNWRTAQAGSLDGLESVTSHEFFHLWNVKRIRPAQLGPFDYSQDVRTRDLWWLEGVTSYYTDVLLQRAGLRPDDWFLDAQARTFLAQYHSNGYGIVSPERASWTVWDPNPQARISYYDQGQSLGFLLDVEIRAATNNQRSLDDVVRFLDQWVRYPDPGYQPGDLERAVRAVSGWDPSAFFARHFRGVVPYPWREVLPKAGVEVLFGEPGDAYLGFGADDDLKLIIREESAAFESGLRNGDKLLRINGTAVKSMDDLRAIVLDLEPESIATIQVRRNGATKSISHQVTPRKRVLFKLTPETQPTPDAAAILDGILTGFPARPTRSL